VKLEDLHFLFAHFPGLICHYLVFKIIKKIKKNYFLYFLYLLVIILFCVLLASVIL
jgi:hypothetical protein